MFKPLKNVRGDHPQGEFHGRIKSAYQGRSEKSGRFITLDIQTPKGVLVTRLFPESGSENAKRIAQQKMKTILAGYDEPPAGRFDWFLDILPLLTGLPVTVYVSNREEQTNVYFREVKPEVRVRRQDGRVVERVQY